MQERHIILLRNASGRGPLTLAAPSETARAETRLSNTAPTIKTIHSSGVIGLHPPTAYAGSCDQSCNNLLPCPAAAERVRVHDRQSIATQPTTSHARQPQP